MKINGAVFMVSAIFFLSSVSAKPGNFTATDNQGTTHTLYNYLDAGKYVIISFASSG